eukprot:TRINITY_DN6075_c0_g1_i1.p1 TRINITY_DN6075_c0_g1~~TRINITY_DN6075_c0_g1_i1.p1  ORF type:complete len:376 (-),score=56.78 TRINITY_DN6075_c0_g1_i1:146-1219(-)
MAMVTQSVLGKRVHPSKEEYSKGDVVLNQLLILTNMVAYLDKHTVKYLTLTSRAVSKKVRSFIEENWVFRLRDNYLRFFKGIFKFYNPKKIFWVDSIAQIAPYFNNLTHINLSWEFSEPILAFPPNLVYLEFSKYNNYFTYPIKNLPPNLTHLYLPNEYNHPIELPTKLKHFRVGTQWDQPVDMLPQSVTHLYLGDSHFNHPIYNLPPNLQTLTLSKYISYYNLVIEFLPQTITFLYFGDNFNEPITAGNLPPHLTHLILGQNFNRSIAQLPVTITHLHVDYCFNQPINSILPPKLQHLLINSNYFDREVTSLPASLTQLYVRYPEKAKIADKYKPLLNRDFPDWVIYQSPVFTNYG